MKKINKHLLLVLMLCLILLELPFSYACNGGAAIKTVFSSIQGEVLVKKMGTNDWIKGEVEMALYEGDVIKSGTEANTIIIFFDGSTIELKPGTQIQILELIKKPAKVIRLRQEIGETISTVEKLIDPASRYEIETPTAVAGVRGSSMLVKVDPDGTTTVRNLSGQISVKAQGVEVKIPQGSVGIVKPGEPPELELAYDDGIYDGGYSLGGIQQYGYMVLFEPPVQQFKITKIKIYSWIKGTPKETDKFTIRITDKALSLLWEITLPYALFTTDPSWLEVKTTNITINDIFNVQLYAPTLGQGLGPYIGKDESGLNQHSELLSGWKITDWTLTSPKEQVNWMIRVNGIDAVPTGP